MSQKSLEIILFRQLATYITMPSFILDSDGNIIYCNKHAEDIFGFKFSEINSLSTNNWQILFSLKDKHEKILPIDKSPLYIASTEFRIAHEEFYFTNLQEQLKHIELFAIPVINHMDTFLGCVAFFQEIKS